jgi:hypothetical protein
LRAKIVDDEEDAAERIDNTVKAADEVRRDFGRNPSGWHDFSPISASCFLPIFAILAASHFLI